jgi:hypothetical protein
MPDYAQPSGAASIEFRVLLAGLEEIAALPGESGYHGRRTANL